MGDKMTSQHCQSVVDPRAAPLFGDDLGFDSAGIVRTGVGFRCDIFGTIWGPERPHFILLRSCLVFHHGE